MEYKITIEKMERNPDYKPRESIYDSHNKNLEYIQFPALTFSASDKQFEAIRKAALEVF